MLHTALHTTRHGGLGYLPDKIDINDHAYQMEVSYEDLPPLVDLRSGCGPVDDQGQLGSCVGYAIASMLRFMRKKQGESDIELARLMIYFMARDIEGTVNEDAGAQIRDGIKAVVKYGVCPESEWQYDINRYTERPPQQCYTDALNFQTLEYQRIQTYSLTKMKSCLAAGFTYVFGFLVYQSFESQQVASTGVVPMPRRGEPLLGGHAVHAVGYNDAKKCMLVKNSWGTNWGMDGYFEMPYTYFTQNRLVSDLWMIRKVE